MQVTSKSFNFAAKRKLPFFFVSASDGTNVVKIFNMAIMAGMRWKAAPKDDFYQEVGAGCRGGAYKHKAWVNGDGAYFIPEPTDRGKPNQLGLVAVRTALCGGHTRPSMRCGAFAFGKRAGGRGSLFQNPKRGGGVGAEMRAQHPDVRVDFVTGQAGDGLR